MAMVCMIVLIMAIVFITVFAMIIMVIICMILMVIVFITVFAMVIIHLRERKCMCNVLSMNLRCTIFLHGKGCCFIRTCGEEFTQF